MPTLTNALGTAVAMFAGIYVFWRAVVVLAVWCCDDTDLPGDLS